MKNILMKYLIFIKERFSPIENILPVFIFFIGNVIFSSILLNMSYRFTLSHIAAFILITLIFFHMRLFDEVKDYETDKIFHKDRPLPRGLLNLNQIGFLTLVVILTELLLTLYIGRKVFISYIITLCFTLLMRLEFFISDFLKPKLTTYAITHTFSSFFIGILSISFIFDISIFEMPLQIFIFSLANWFTFNIYEFARKSFSIEEEINGVQSYSKLFKSSGAFLLVLVNVLFTNLSVILSIILINKKEYILFFLFFLIIPVIICLFAGVLYIKNNNRKFAKIYRNIMSIYLVSFYLILIISSIVFLSYNK